MYSQHVILSTFSLFPPFTATYFSKARYSLFVLQVPLSPNQSIIWHDAEIHGVQKVTKYMLICIALLHENVTPIMRPSLMSGKKICWR